MSQDLQNSKIILTFFVFVIFISFIPSNIFGLEECPKNNLKARLNYDSGVFWAGRGKYQKAYDLLSEALKICPNFSDAITKQNEVEKILEEQRQVEKIEREMKLKAQLVAQREAEERRRYEAHLRSERERVFREAREREKKEQEERKKVEMEPLRKAAKIEIDRADYSYESCYSLGKRYGKCAGRAFQGLPCSPEDDFAMPVRCRDKDETQEGIEAGLRSVF